METGRQKIGERIARVRDDERSTDVQEETKMKVASRVLAIGELSFRGIIHIVCQTNERGGKLAGARNIAFSSASPKKEESAMCVAIPSPSRPYV